MSKPMTDAAEIARAQQAAEWMCEHSPGGYHIVDTSMESGANHCFGCEKPMPVAPLTLAVRAHLTQEQPR